MYVEQHDVTLTTDASGDATGFTPTITGCIVGIIYTKTDFATGVDFTITSERTGQTIWTELNVDASKTVAPRQPTHDTAGIASEYAATFPVEDRIYLAKDRVKIVIAQGGNVKTGKFSVIVA